MTAMDEKSGKFFMSSFQVPDGSLFDENFNRCVSNHVKVLFG